ncbi:MAG: ParB/RepB/Spo0J family partition protein [Pseudomonadales bacterium]|nr:ParB/RepB/Spo0J family partition protein [Pseudomonadales bacterium]MDG2078243.1 ParB/RepB/Spo0J family partition protein [Pseudomonadales bacterium]
MAGKKKGLGKGLDALLGGINTQMNDAADSPISPTQSATGASTAQTPDDSQIAQQGALDSPMSLADANRVVQVPVEHCQRGKYQPRRAIDNEALEELASSIVSQGVMQPIILRELAAPQLSGAKYEIVAGERRWRASQLAGLQAVPAIVRDLDDEAASAMALIENLQREDLNPMDQAHALARLQEQFEFTHQQIADLVGKSRAAVSNFLRLLGLQVKVQQLLENGDLEMGHARALLAVDQDTQQKLAREVVNQSLTVRQTEALVKKQLNPKKLPAANAVPAGRDANIDRLQNDLSEKLGVPVLVKHASSGQGQLILKYHNLDELDGILEHIK